jgi:hypothetical protein
MTYYPLNILFLKLVCKRFRTCGIEKEGHTYILQFKLTPRGATEIVNEEQAQTTSFWRGEKIFNVNNKIISFMQTFLQITGNKKNFCLAHISGTNHPTPPT